MEGQIPQASVPAADSHSTVRSNLSNFPADSGDVVLRLLHTADWHLGRRFPSFPEEAQKKLSRARMNVIANILDVARRNTVHALLCAGDLFDDPEPEPDFWEGLARTLQQHAAPHPPIFLVPGNHDPLTPESVWAPGHPFRARLPKWVHIVDRDDFTYDLAPDVVLYARPCRSKAGENDLAMALPARETGDERLRIGCVHGCTFDIDGYQTNFPICRDAGVQRGLDYLAIGDTHSFRDVTPNLPVPTVYPSAPEPTSFDESGAGNVALVALFRRGRRPRVDAEPVAFWRWVDVQCRDMNELRSVLTIQGLDRHVVRLHLDMTVSLSEESEVERILRDLQGTDATHGRAGVLVVDRANLQLMVGSGDAFPDDLPPVLKDTVDRLDRLIAEAADESEKSKATRALAHLYKLLQNNHASTGRRAL
jgi:DNA repair exonuclease SbcCD nuclease subunit